jgi:hypothetical protein
MGFWVVTRVSGSWHDLSTLSSGCSRRHRPECWNRSISFTFVLCLRTISFELYTTSDLPLDLPAGLDHGGSEFSSGPCSPISKCERSPRHLDWAGAEMIDRTCSLLYYLVPPIVLLLGLYYPLLGRRDALKLAWVSLMVRSSLGNGCFRIGTDGDAGDALDGTMGQRGSLAYLACTCTTKAEEFSVRRSPEDNVDVS